MKNGDALKDMGGGWLLVAQARTDECELVRLASAAGGYNLVATTVRYQAAGPNQAEAMAKAIMSAAATFGQPGAAPTQVPVPLAQPQGQPPQSTAAPVPIPGPMPAQGQPVPSLFGQTGVVGQVQHQLHGMQQAAVVVEYEIMPGITTETVNLMANVGVETLQRHGLTDVAASMFRSRKGIGTTVQLRGSLPGNLAMDSFVDIAESEFGRDCRVCKAGEENLPDGEDTL